MTSGDLVIGRSGHRKNQQLALSNWQLARYIWEMLGAALGEIFDESAYNRFLQRTNTTRTRQSYRAFMREREAASAQRPRCC